MNFLYLDLLPRYWWCLICHKLMALKAYFHVFDFSKLLDAANIMSEYCFTLGHHTCGSLFIILKFCIGYRYFGRSLKMEKKNKN